LFSSSYGTQQLPGRIQNTFADQTIVPQQTYGQQQSYGSQQIPVSRVIVSPQQLLLDQQQQLQQKIQETQTLSEAGEILYFIIGFYFISFFLFFLDILCRGQQAETVIPVDNGRKFVVCLDDSKGFEQQCPKGLVYHQESRRCERSMSAFLSVFFLSKIFYFLQ
jgi:hypothetical protein